MKVAFILGFRVYCLFSTFKFYDYAAKALYALANVYRDIGETEDEFKSLLESFKYYSNKVFIFPI